MRVQCGRSSQQIENAEWVWHIFGEKEPGRLRHEAERIKDRRSKFGMLTR